MVLISTHVMEEVDALADRVILLKDGKGNLSAVPWE